MGSVEVGVEDRRGLGHLGALVVFVHLRNVDARVIKLGTVQPPLVGEVLADGAAKVGAMGRRLGQQVVVGLAVARVVLHEYAAGAGEGQPDGETHHPLVLLAGEVTAAPEQHGASVASHAREQELGPQLHHHEAEELLHLENLPLGKVVVLHAIISQKCFCLHRCIGA